eukprot:1845320-Amphidinium_carterae.2
MTAHCRSKSARLHIVRPDCCLKWRYFRNLAGAVLVLHLHFFLHYRRLPWRARPIRLKDVSHF